ncbi:zinc-binding dehydrogenase [Anaerosinus massiliensis]|uniref:zinc-binding dehydrogenase n=1 Tax=Massilibacillus massiliensis TaxID=1806837 RepID=UPI000AB3C129|nr:zinc-binding dehydrogenase [Massilibacillus massiliensis]
MKALVKTALGEGNLEVLDRDEPQINDDQVKIKVKYAGICGSDLHTYEGHYKVAAPVTLGHEFSGEVVEVGANVKNFKAGDRVTSETTFEICGTCRYCKEKKYNLCSTRKGLGTQQNGAFTNYIIARKESVHLLPENVTYLDASITEAAACAYHGVAKAKIEKDDIVLVLGPGPIGLLVAQVVRAKGGKVVMTGLTKDAKRLDEAKALGVAYTIDVQTESPREIIDKLTDGYGADVCFDCTGAVPSMQMGMDLLRKQGQYVQVGIFAKDEVVVDFSKIIQKELVVTGSRSQNTHDWEPTLALMNSGAIKASAMVTHKMKIDEWDKAYQLLKSGEAIKIALEPLD